MPSWWPTGPAARRVKAWWPVLPPRGATSRISICASTGPLALGERFQVKRIQVNPGAALSLQRHRQRAEHWVVIAGEGLVRVGDEEMHLHVDQSVYIPQKTMHRLSNASAQPLEIVEVQTGDYLGEDDIERFDDRYGRG